MRNSWSIQIALALAAASCGKTPPPDAQNRSQIESLPVTTRMVQARGLSDADLPALARLKDLDRIDFGWGCMAFPSRITDRGLEILSTLDLPKLRHLAFGYCDHISDAGLAHLATMQRIAELQIHGCGGITDAGLAQVARMKGLATLDLRGCESISDAGIDALSSIPSLRELLLGGCVRVTADGIAQLAAKLPTTTIKKDEWEWAMHSESRDPARPR